MNSVEIAAAWEGPPQCENCGIRHLVLFSSLERDDFALIHEPIDELRYDKGETLFRAGERGEHVFTVREGIVKLVNFSAEGKERIVRLLLRGDVVGLEALVGQPYLHHAVPLNPALTCRIPVTVVNDLSQRLPKFHQEILTRWQRAVNEADTWLAELVNGPVKARLARLLIRLAEAEPGDSCFLPSREDIGAMLAVTTESASRATASFNRAGLIEYVGPQRVRVQLDQLRELAI